MCSILNDWTVFWIHFCIWDFGESASAYYKPDWQKLEINAYFLTYFSNLPSVHSIQYLRKTCCSFFCKKKKKMVNRINESYHCKVLLWQSVFRKKSLSILFYDKQFKVQQLRYEKLGMTKLPCKKLTLSLSFSLSET